MRSDLENIVRSTDTANRSTRGQIVRHALGSQSFSHQHGIATLAAGLITSAPDATISGYKSVEGNQPDTAPTTVENSNNLSGDTGDQVLVRKDGDTWTLVAVIEQSSGGGGSGEVEDHPHMVAVSGQNFDGDDAHITISTVRSYLGMDPLSTAPTGAKNTFALTGSVNQAVLLVPSEGTDNWAPSTAYTTGDIVRHTITTSLTSLTGLFKRNATGTSGSTFDESDWTRISVESAGAWQTGAGAYASGDIVQMEDPAEGPPNEYLWLISQSHTPASTWTADVSDWVKIGSPGTPEEDWEVSARFDSYSDSGEGEGGSGDASRVATASIAVDDLASGDATQAITGFRTSGDQPDPVPSSASNPHGFEGSTGDKLLLGEDGTDWEILEVYYPTKVAYANISGTDDLDTGDTSHPIDSFSQIVGDYSTAPTTAGNPFSLEAPNGKQVMINSTDGGTTWDIVGIPQDYNTGLAVAHLALTGTTELESTDTQGTITSPVTITHPDGDLNKVPPTSSAGIENDEDIAGIAGETVLLKHDREDDDWQFFLNLSRTVCPVLPAVAVTNISGATAPTSTGASPTTSGSIKLIESDDSYGPTLTNIRWYGEGTIEGSASNPVMIWVQYRDGNWWILGQDKAC